LSLTIYVLSHYLALVLLALISYILGKRLLLGLVFDSKLESFCFSTAIGLGVLAYLVYFMGIIGLLYKLYIFIAIIVGILVCYKVWGDWLFQFKVIIGQIKKEIGKK